jgi:hypothetical protein
LTSRAPEIAFVLPVDQASGLENPNGKQKKISLKRPGKGIYVTQGIYNRTRKQSNEGRPLDDPA